MTKAKSGNGQPLKLNFDIIIDGMELEDGRKLPASRLSMTPEEALELGGPEAVASMVNALRRGQLHTELPQGVTDNYTAHQPKSNISSMHPTLTEAFERYFRYKSESWKTPKTKAQYNGTLRLLNKYFDDRRLDQISKMEAVEFFALLEKLPPNIFHVKSKYKDQDLQTIAKTHQGESIGAKTFNDHLIRINAVYSWIAKVSEQPLSNPFEAVDPKDKKATSKGYPFSDDSIAKIFSCYLFSDQEPWPARKRANEPSKYWMPILLALTGCRINEISQLYLEDINTHTDGTLILNIRGAQPDQRTKTDTERRVPVHPSLIKLGFRDYLKILRTEGHERLFPELKFSDNGDGYSRSIGEFLNSLYKEVGADGTNHSFRHLVIRTLSRADIPKEIIKSIVGHYDGSAPEDVTDKYGGSDKYSIEQKIKAIKTIRPAFLDTIIDYESFRKRAGTYRYSKING
ncbi:site-specific integrase [Pseudohongiella sp. O18]|uniref:site-specific integrase n=1 Tax=Pseudohongiella sp. O18 TaxID=2904248 RepID=UPI001F43E34D|nr:site-specific integrase [Pseudohongiella sp. O18]